MTRKVYLDECYFCRESKAAIKHSQSVKDPIFCGEVDYFGECQWERDRHCFVVTQEVIDADVAAELEGMKQMGEMADWFAEHPLEATT